MCFPPATSRFTSNMKKILHHQSYPSWMPSSRPWPVQSLFWTPWHANLQTVFGLCEAFTESVRMHLLLRKLALYRKPHAQRRTLHMLSVMPQRQQLSILGLAALFVDHLGTERSPSVPTLCSSTFGFRLLLPSACTATAILFRGLKLILTCSLLQVKLCCKGC